MPRTAKIERKTNETDISLSLNLDGSGVSQIATGVGFFDHMLELLTRHAAMDLEVAAQGDLHIDQTLASVSGKPSVRRSVIRLEFVVMAISHCPWKRRWSPPRWICPDATSWFLKPIFPAPR